MDIVNAHKLRSRSVAKCGSKSIGSGMTAASVKFTELDSPSDAEQFVRWHVELREISQQPWAWHRDVIASVRRRWEEIQAELATFERYSPAHQVHFRERETEAWYVREVVTTARAVELAVEGNVPWEAVAPAMQIGELLAEARLKFAWEQFALAGRKQLEGIHKNAEVSAARRQRRIAAVREVVARRKSLRNAFEIVGKREGVTGHVIKKDYYWKKRSTALE